MDSVVVLHGFNCPAACGISPDQGSNPRPLHWQVESYPLDHQGTPAFLFLILLVLQISTCQDGFLTAGHHWVTSEPFWKLPSDSPLQMASTS